MTLPNKKSVTKKTTKLPRAKKKPVEKVGLAVSINQTMQCLTERIHVINQEIARLQDEEEMLQEALERLEEIS